MENIESTQTIAVLKKVEARLIYHLSNLKTETEATEARLKSIKEILNEYELFRPEPPILDQKEQSIFAEQNIEYYNHLPSEFSKEWVLGQKIYFIIRENQEADNNQIVNRLIELHPERYNDVKKTTNVVQTTTSKLKRWKSIGANEDGKRLVYKVNK